MPGKIREDNHSDFRQNLRKASIQHFKNSLFDSDTEIGLYTMYDNCSIQHDDPVHDPMLNHDNFSRVTKIGRMKQKLLIFFTEKR